MGCIGISVCFVFQAEDGIRDLVRSRGLGDVYKRQSRSMRWIPRATSSMPAMACSATASALEPGTLATGCLLYTSDAADERSSVDLGGRRIIKKKNNTG